MAMVHGNEIPYRRFVFWISGILQPVDGSFFLLRISDAECSGKENIYFSQ